MVVVPRLYVSLCGSAAARRGDGCRQADGCRGAPPATIIQVYDTSGCPVGLRTLPAAPGRQSFLRVSMIGLTGSSATGVVSAGSSATGAEVTTRAMAGRA